MKKLLMIFIGLICWNSSFNILVQAKASNLEVYYGNECPHCHQELKWLEEIQNTYPELKVQLFEVWHNKENAMQWQARMKDLGQEVQGVPTTVIGDDIIVGFNKEEIEKSLGILENYQSSEKPIKNNLWEKYLTYSWPIMSIVLGLIDGFNPCAMWTLFMLISLLLVIDDKRKRWLIGGVFLITSGLIYGGALLTYLFGFKAIITLLATQTISWLFKILGFIAVITGLITLYNAPKAGVDCKIRDADSKQKFHQKLNLILQRENIWWILLGIVGLAISVNAIELLCSFVIPTTFTATILSLELPLYQQLIAVSLYDLMYMLDDIIVFSIAMYTLNLKILSPKITKITHIIGSLILLILGFILIVNPSILTSI